MEIFAHPMKITQRQRQIQTILPLQCFELFLVYDVAAGSQVHNMRRQIIARRQLNHNKRNNRYPN